MEIPVDPWNEGESTRLKEEWQYIDDPLQEVRNTNGLVDRKPEGTERTEKQVRAMDQKLAKERSSQVLSATPDKDLTWCDYQNLHLLVKSRIRNKITIS